MDHCNVAQRAFTQIVDIYTGPLEEGNVTPMMVCDKYSLSFSFLSHTLSLLISFEECLK